MVIPDFATGEPLQGWHGYEALGGHWHQRAIGRRFHQFPFDRTRLWLAQFAADRTRLRSLWRGHVELTMPNPSPDAEISLAMAATLLCVLIRPRQHSPMDPRHTVTCDSTTRPMRPQRSNRTRTCGIRIHSWLSSTAARDPVIRLVFGAASSSGIPVTAAAGGRASGTHAHAARGTR